MDDRQLLDSRESPSEEAIARIDREFREGFVLLERIPQPAVAVFGSARIGPAIAIRAVCHGLPRVYLT